MTLREYKDAQNLTLPALARRLQHPYNTVASWLYGHRKPRPGVCAALSRRTGGAVTFADFYVDETVDEPDPNQMTLDDSLLGVAQ